MAFLLSSYVEYLVRVLMHINIHSRYYVEALISASASRPPLLVRSEPSLSTHVLAVKHLSFATYTALAYPRCTPGYIQTLLPQADMARHAEKLSGVLDYLCNVVPYVA